MNKNNDSLEKTPTFEVRDRTQEKWMQRRIGSMLYMRSDGSKQKIETSLQMGTDNLIYTFPNKISIKVTAGGLLKQVVPQLDLDETKLFEEDDYLL